ncbi:hypothetical protein C943_03120 [Mariniradius saccharolyticus AK6]|uniref:Uncharacterized protein n=1 Tax=Mariniradius saccharolyticus AK6 TaxID=1239962 RepID=M7WZY5_9BACT|nr:hypothetical protein C943_03120 [Mariniradius saccharolyticus AK6]
MEGYWVIGYWVIGADLSGWIRNGDIKGMKILLSEKQDNGDNKVRS